LASSLTPIGIAMGEIATILQVAGFAAKLAQETPMHAACQVAAGALRNGFKFEPPHTDTNLEANPSSSACHSTTRPVTGSGNTRRRSVRSRLDAQPPVRPGHRRHRLNP